MLELVLDVPEWGRKFDGLTTHFAASSMGFGSGEMGSNQLLGISDRPVGADEFLCQKALASMILDGEEHLGMSEAQPSLLEMGLHLGVEFQKTHGVGHRGTALADALADLFLSEAEFLR